MFSSLIELITDDGVKEGGMSDRLYRNLCVFALIAAVIGIIVQVFVGGATIGVISAVAAALGFVSGYRWHKRRIRRMRSDNDSG